MKKTYGRILALALTVALAAAMVPGVPAGATDGVEYIDVDGGKKTQDGVTPVASDTTSWTDGWYVVNNSTVTVADRITVTGEVYLILADGCTLNANQGISVNSGNSLTIYAQSDGSSMGKLVAKGGASSTYTSYGLAAIGGNTSGKDDPSAGTIIINGGDITATADQTLTNGAAGIGGGANAGGCKNITINGGKVTATGGKGGAGIGVGGVGLEYAPNCNITINGGTIVATGYDKGPGIGGNNGSITITGGNITANAKMTGTNYASVAAGIGSGSTRASDTLTITISGGLIHAQEEETQGNGIGGSNNSSYNSGTVNFYTGENGNAVIYGRKNLPKTDGISCVYFEAGVVGGNTVYGNPVPTVSFELEAGDTFVVPEGTTLTLPDGVTMTIPSGATVNNNGHIITDGGRVQNNGGNITKEAEEGPAYGVSVDAITFTGITYGGETPEAKEITIKNTGVLATTINSVELSGTNAESFELTGSGTAELEKRNDTNTSWTIQPNDELDAGTYSATVTVTYTGRNGAPQTATAEVSLTVDKAESEVTPSEPDGITYEYGADGGITLEVDVKRKEADGISLASADQDQVVFTFEKNGETMTAPVTYDNETDKDSGTATFTIQPKDVKTYFKPGENNVTVSYGGSINLEGKENVEIKVTVNPKTLNFTFTATDRAYNGTTTVTGTLSEPEALSGDNVTANYTANMDDANAGNDKNVNVTVTLEGADKDYYEAKAITGVTVDISKADITGYTAPTLKSEITYNGEAQQLIASEASSLPVGTTIYYYVGPEGDAATPGDDGWQTDYTAIKATEAGTYHVWYKVTGGTNYKDIEATEIGTATISKTAPTYTKPTAKSGLVYTGNAQQLVDAGQTDHGTIQYSLSQTGEYDTIIPTGTDAKTYEVWYKVVGDENHADVGPNKIDVTIGQAASTVTVGDVTGAVYGGNITLTATVTAGEIDKGSITGMVQFEVDGAELGEAVEVTEGTATLTIRADDVDKQHTLFGDTGTTQVTAEYTGNTNIAGNTSTEKEVSVQRKELTFSFTAHEKTYNGDTTVTGTLSEPIGLVGSDTVESSCTASAESADVGDRVKVTVTVTITGDNARYYTVKNPTDVTVKIVKAAVTDTTAPTPKAGLIYNGAEQALIQTEGSATGGTMKYYVGEKGVATQPGGEVEWKDAADIKGKDAGTYYVWYKVVGDGNHNDTNPESIIVKIEQKEVTLEWTGHEGLTYTGSAHTISATVNNKEDDDEVNVTVAVTANGGETGASGAAATNAGSYTAKATGLAGRAANNYKLPDNPTQTFTIAKATVDFEIDGDTTFTYDTNTHTVTVKEEETDTTKLPSDGNPYSVVYTAKDAGNSSGGTENKTDFGTYDVWVKLSTDAYKNYMFEGDEQEFKVGTMTINQAELTLTVAGSAITYGQTLNESKLEGTAKIAGDGGATIPGSFAWDTTDGAKYPTVADSNKTNYKVTFTPSSGAGNFTDGSKSTTITIEVKPFTLTPQVVESSVSSKTYDGNTNVTGGTLTFAEDLDKAPFNTNTPTATGTFEFTDKNVGKNKSVKVTGITISATDASSYQLKDGKDTIESAATTAEITAKEVTLEWSSPTEFTYTGEAQGVTVTVKTGVDGESLTATLNEDKATDAGSYTAEVTALVSSESSDANNYKLPAAKTQAYTIKKAEVTFEVTDNTVDYDTKAHKATVTQTVDEVKIPDGGYTVVYTDSDSSNSTGGTADKTKAGTYDIWVKLSNDNFKFKGDSDETREKKLTEKLSIKQAELTLTINPVTVTYGDALTDTLLSGKATISDGTEITGTWAWGEADKGKNPAVSDSENTEYTVKFTPDEEYAGNFVETTLSTEVTITVNKYVLTPKVVASSVTSRDYDGNTDVTGGTLEFENMELFDNAPFSGTQPTISGTFAYTSKDAGTNTVNVTGIEFTANSDNYSLSTNKIDSAAVDGAITAKEVTLSWALDGKDELTTGYTGTEHTVTATATTGVEGETVNVTVTDGEKTNAGSYEATASGLTDGEGGGLASNYKLPSDVTQAYTINPAEVSFTIGTEIKAAWPSSETNDDPNPDGGYKIEGDAPNYTLTMTYDSYTHKANVKQTDGETVKIGAGTANGYTVTYKKGDAETSDVKDAGTYEIYVTINPVTKDVYNFKFADQGEDVHELKIGTIEIMPYEVTVIWTHLSYVYHAHTMHPDIRVQNPFKSDNNQLLPGKGLPSDFNIEHPENYDGEYLVAFGATDGSDVKEYTVTAGLYGQKAANYTVKNPTATVTIVPAPVTFTVSNNVWNLAGEHPTTVTLNPVWGVVSTTPDKDEGTDHQYPDPGTAIDAELNTKIVYKMDGEEITAPDVPTKAGTYEVWVEIGNKNFRHSATSDGASHKVGELVLTDNPASVKTYTVTFDAGYEGGTAPEAMTNLLEGQMVILPAGLTREGYLFQGWSHGGITYRPNEEFPMPASDVTFKAEWLDESETRKVGGTVLQEVEGGDPKPLLGATVTLKQGDNEAGEAITDASGEFSFENLTPGIYNLEIRYFNGSSTVIKTFRVDVEKNDMAGETYILPDGALNTVVDADVTAVVDMQDIVEAPDDAGIYTNADADIVEDGGTVEFKMTVKGTELEVDQIEELPVSEEQIGMVLNLELTKTVTGSSSDGTTEIHDSKVPITTVIHLPAEIQGKSGYTVYRFHTVEGVEELQTITTSRNASGEYLQVIRGGTAIEIHATLYSTYVLTWYQSSPVVDMSGRVTVADTPHGAVTPNYPNAAPGVKVTLTVTPDEGYTVDSVTVTDRNGNVLPLTDNGDGTYSFTMPGGDVTVKAIFKLKPCDGGADCPSRQFPDLDPKSWYHEYTDYVILNGLMNGNNLGLFDPDGTVTRATVVMTLWNYENRPTVDYLMQFTDVKEGQWYTEAIRWAASEGIVGGYGDGTFQPDKPVNREELAKILYGYEQKYGNGGFKGAWMFPLAFADSAKVSGWAYESVAWCTMNGVITGKPGNLFDPAGSAKRSEMAAVLTRYSEMIVKEYDKVTSEPSQDVGRRLFVHEPETTGVRLYGVPGVISTCLMK